MPIHSPKRSMVTFLTNLSSRKVKFTNQGVAMLTTLLRYPFSYLHEQGLQLRVDGINEIIQLVFDILCCREKEGNVLL